MKLITTNVFDRNLAAILANKRLIVNEGGTRSSKTHSIIQILIFIASFSAKPILISIVSESFPHLRRGAMRTFKAIMGETFNPEQWNESKSIYDFGANRIIEFFSADQSAKLRGSGRDILFVNESNNITKEAYDELDVRTTQFTILDHNPVSEYWAHELKGLPFVEWIHSTFLDAVEVLEQTVVDNILSRKDRDPSWWRVYGLGLIGKLEGLIHPNFSQCDELPERFDREVFGIDWGFSQDPFVLVQNRFVGDAVYSRELIYERGLTNDQLIQRFDGLGIRKRHDILIADPEDPKSIQEIYAYGYDIRPADCGKGVIQHGIQKVNQFRQFWTKDSTNCVKEQRNYQWEKDKDGKFTDKPLHEWSHGMCARRYAVATVPAPKVMPAAVKPSSFKIKFDKLTKNSTLLCSIWAEPNLTTSVTLSLWNSDAFKLYIFGEHVFPQPEPESIIKGLTAYVKEYSDQTIQSLVGFDIWGNSVFFDQWGGDLSSAFGKAHLYVRENVEYNEVGAIAITQTLVKNGRIAIAAGCDGLETQMATWKVDKKPEPGYGLARSILSIVSTLYESGKLEPATPPKKLKEYSIQSQKAQKHIEDLVKKAMEGKHENSVKADGWMYV